MTPKPLRSNDIRERNEKLVLQLIYSHAGLSQSKVAQLTGLKPPTVFRIFSQLEEQGLIRECSENAERTERKGRKPSYYCVTPDSFYAIGVDFWSAGAAVLLVDFAGNAVHQAVIEFDAGIGAGEVLRRIEELVQQALAVGIDPERVLGIGVGAPGIVDISAGSVMRYPRISGIEEYNIKAELEERFGLPVSVHNNASVVALSEYRYGQVREEASALAFLLRTGVGGAFVQNGQVFVNREMTAMEIGHMQVERNGKQCECGAKGCLETYLSEDVILEELRLRAGTETLTQAAEQLESGDEAVEETLSEFGDILGDAALSLANILNPEAFLIVSRFRAISTLFAERVTARLRGPGHTYGQAPARVVAEEYDTVTACKGATDLVFDAFFALR